MCVFGLSYLNVLVFDCVCVVLLYCFVCWFPCCLVGFFGGFVVFVLSGRLVLVFGSVGVLSFYQVSVGWCLCCIGF